MVLLNNVVTQRIWTMGQDFQRPHLCSILCPSLYDIKIPFLMLLIKLYTDFEPPMYDGTGQTQFVVVVGWWCFINLFLVFYFSPNQAFGQIETQNTLFPPLHHLWPCHQVLSKDAKKFLLFHLSTTLQHDVIPRDKIQAPQIPDEHIVSTSVL